MKNRGLIILTLILFISFCGKSGENKNDTSSTQMTIEKLLPNAEKNKIEMIETARTFTSDNLWEYIDGAADNFLNYGFQRVITAEYKSKEKEAEFVVDIYKMEDVKNGYGIYASERAADVSLINVGDEGYYSGGSLMFWKDRYYIKMISYNDNEFTKQLLTNAGNDIVKNIGTSKADLPILSWLPENNIKKNTKRYLSKDIVGLEFLKDGYMAEYSEADNNVRLYIIDCTEEHDPAEKLNMYKEHIKGSGKVISEKLPSGKSGFIGEDRYYGNLTASVINDYIIIILGYKNKNTADQLINSINAHINSGN